MQRILVITCLFAFAIPVLTVNAQSSNDGFSWDTGFYYQTHEEASKVRQTRILNAASNDSQIRNDNSPTPPGMKRQPFLVSFKKQDQEAQSVQVEDLNTQADTQPSLSDTTNEPLVQPEMAEPQPIIPAPVEMPAPIEPELSVQSNKQPEPNYCNRGNCCGPRCNLGCERQLFPTNCRGARTGGWVSLGYHNRDTINLNNRRDEVALHQAWLFRERPASRASCHWDIGYRVDLLYGIDAQDLQAFGNAPTGAPSGWDNSWDYGSYGWALPQAYVQLANADWDVKIGKFFSPFGYEVIAAPSNFFYSRSYTMYNMEPFTMTGILTEKQVAPGRSVILGATLGWDTAFENNSGGNLITGVRLQPNEFVDLAMVSSIGDTGIRGTGMMTSTVAQLQLTRNISYVMQADLLNIEDDNEIGFIQYLFNEVTPCLKLGARLEWWKSDQFTVPNRSTYEVTIGANYRYNANTTLRPEVRFDWGQLAVDKGQAIIGLDAVVKF